MSDYTQSIRGDVDGVVRQFDYEAESVVAVDLGHVDGTVDIVDGTAIVVVGDEQHEFEVPAGASRAVMNNGIVSIEVER
ncbi:DUF7127 family protein [Natronomonas marina]|jgi:hypothetical protein|uniref:DUF7127 family protein n=1 Tax=Natronomonas marina TaxID=2961939 RepID=UPI0020C93AC4|nr:hypothetical protein [Natronomonas marina]